MLTERISFYVEVLETLIPLFFALIFEDECLFTFETWKSFLEINLRTLDTGFCPKPISVMPINQTHEQENGYVKGSGGTC